MVELIGVTVVICVFATIIANNYFAHRENMAEIETTRADDGDGEDEEVEG